MKSNPKGFPAHSAERPSARRVDHVYPRRARGAALAVSNVPRLCPHGVNSLRTSVSRQSDHIGLNPAFFHKGFSLRPFWVVAIVAGWRDRKLDLCAQVRRVVFAHVTWSKHSTSSSTFSSRRAVWVVAGNLEPFRTARHFRNRLGALKNNLEWLPMAQFSRTSRTTPWLGARLICAGTHAGVASVLRLFDI